MGILPAPDIQAGITKAKAAGSAPQTVNTGSKNFMDLIASAAGQQQQADATTIPLWRATHKVTSRHIGPGGEETFRSQSQNTTPDQYAVDAASTQFGVLLMAPAKMAEWGDLAWKAGLITADNRNDANALGKAWDIAINWAVNIKKASNGSTEVTPFEAAKMVAQNTGSALLAQQADSAAHFTGNKTVETTTDKRPPANSGDVLHQLLGRNPTAGEQATYQHGLNQTAAAHPISTERVGHYVDGALTSSTSTVTGGYDEHAAQIQQASSASPDVARNQQATTFYQALVDAIGAAV